MSYYYIGFGTGTANTAETNLTTIYDSVDEIPTAGSVLAIYRAIGGLAIDAYGPQRSPASPGEVVKKGVLIASTRHALYTAYWPLRALRGQRSRLFRRIIDDPDQSVIDQWADARCVSVSENTAHEFGHAYYLPIDLRFQLISPNWYSLVFHGMESSLDWGDLPTEFDVFVVKGTEMEAAGASITVTNGGSINSTDAIIYVDSAATTVTSVTIQANVCQLTWTGTLLPYNRLTINCAAKSVLNAGNSAYSGLSFGPQHRTHEWFILQPGANTITVTGQTGQTDPTVTFSFYEPWE